MITTYRTTNLPYPSCIHVINVLKQRYQLPPNAPLAILSKLEIEVDKTSATAAAEASATTAQTLRRVEEAKPIEEGGHEKDSAKSHDGIKTSTVVTEGPKKTAVTKSTIVAEPPAKIVGFYAYVEVSTF